MIDRLAMIDSPDEESYSLVRFRERLSRHLYLVECLNPSTGEPNKLGSYLLDLRVLSLCPGAEHARAKVFDDWAAVRAFLDWVEEPPAERVVKLVRS
jgi:hypothetical protein